MENENMKTKNKINTIGLYEVLQICTQYKDGKISQEELEDFGEKVLFRKYIPLNEKAIILDYILFLKDQYEQDSLEWAMIDFEANKFWHVLLKYTNIETEGYEDILNIPSYDIIFPVIGEWILSQCEFDYKIMLKMIDDAINIYNIKNLLSLFENISSDDLSKRIEELKAQTEGLSSNKELIKEVLNNILK